MQETRHDAAPGASHRPFEGRLPGAWPDARLATILAQRVKGMLQYFPNELRMDRAHTVMLAEQGIISDADAAAILGVLAEVETRGIDPASIDGSKSTLFWYVEAALIDGLGVDVGGKMHTGRSHNDILPTLSRMTARDRLIGIVDAVLTFRRALLRLAAEHVDTVMPGYTALQHGQPWTFGHYLSGWDYAFARDFERLQGAWKRTNVSSLGGSALAGSSWPLDRDRTAALLGFDGIVRHSRDAGFGTKDYVAEILATLGIMMSNLSTLCGDLYLWSTYEFGMLEVADGFCGTSSIMPQKKNAWALDWTRGAAGNSIGYFASCLGALRGTSSTDAMAQEYPDWPLADACTEATDYLILVAGVLDSLKVNKALMLERARSNWTTASNLADAIVRFGGFSFRSAHGIVGRVVREAGLAGIGPDQVDAGFLDKVAVAIAQRPAGLSDAQIREALDPLAFVATRVTAGSVNVDEVRAMLAEGGQQLDDDRDWLAQRRDRVSAAAQTLEAEVARRLEGAEP
jgi:argininosuccinate lyase